MTELADQRRDTEADDILDALYAVILARRGGDPTTSHTAKLYDRGTDHIAKKMGEEAVELVIEAVKGDRARTISESADLIYHLLVLWADAGVRPDDVWQALAERRGISGIAEKAARKKRD